MDVAAWLRGLGLGQYEAAFHGNHVDGAVLRALTAEDLKELGVASIGHRRRLLDAVAALRGAEAGPPAVPSPSSAAAVAPSEAGAAQSAERRQVMVLFCDLAGSTALSARLDPEDLREVMAAYHRATAEAVRRQGGHVAKFLGDGVLACFGWPAAHEDDAERAVRAGLAAAAAVARLETPAGPLAARVGIATGPVVVGHLVGEGEARERGVVGETPNLAARLQAMAEPGAVVLDGATRRLAGGLFEWADLGTAELKGLPRAVHAWRALRESRFEALRAGHAAPLVGREEELDLLLRRWRRARSGEGQTVVLRGEAGIGKSRLVAALREALLSEGREELVFYCSPQHTQSALHPAIARLERAADLVPGDAPEERLAKLEALLAPLAPPPEDVALLAELRWTPRAGLGMVQYLRGRSDLARPVLEEVAAAGPGAYEAGNLVVSGGSIAQTFLARLLAGLGALDRSAVHAAEAIERARRAGNLSSLLNTLIVCCVQAWLVRDTGLLRSRVQAIAELAEAHGSFLYWTARVRGYAGWVAVEEGRVEEGVGLMAGGLAALRKAGMALTAPNVEAMLSDACLLGSDVDAALVHAEEALRISARTGETWLDADLHRRLGRVLLRLGSKEAARAEGELQRALNVARSQSARLFELRAARDLARHRRDQGRVAEARGLLAPVYAAFTEGFAFPDLVEARALLAELGDPGVGAVPARRSGPEAAMRR